MSMNVGFNLRLIAPSARDFLKLCAEGRMYIGKSLMLFAGVALTLAACGAKRDFDVRDYGGSAAKAADAAAQAGGGRIIVPVGVWNSGTVWLKDHCELHLVKGATLLGSTEQRDYNADDVFSENFHSVGEEWSGGHLVMAYKATDVAITGEGTIDGNGLAFFGEPDEDTHFPYYKYGLKLFPRDRTWYRPGPMIAMFLSKNIRLSGVTLKNTPCWTVHLRCCDGVDIRGVTIDADRTIANSDGFSLDCTRNATIRDCTVRTGDDSFALRASCRLHAATNFCENISIENCDIWGCCFGLRYGIGNGTVRNITVRNCRVHEAAHAVGFSPTWIGTGKGVYFQNIKHYDCTFDQCMSPVSFDARNMDTRLEDILFENCRASSLEPASFLGNPPGAYSNIVFRDCSRKTLDRLTVRFSPQWGRAHPDRNRSLLAANGSIAKAISQIQCRPPAIFDGALVLSFDDRNFAAWQAAEPIFAKYDAHATFFVSGAIDDAAKRTMKYLYERGHSIGLHGLRHANADAAIAVKGAQAYYADDILPQTEACRVGYVFVRSFAYPNCRRSEASDALFKVKRWARRIRGGVKGATPYDPTGAKQKDRKPLLTNDAVFIPADEIGRRYRLDTIILGEAYHTDIDEILACLKRAKERREVIVMTSHGISPDAKGINLKTEWLEKILSRAQKLGLPVLGFDELPPPQG